jgi:tRNA (guanine-N7-)-methyltransferase
MCDKTGCCKVRMRNNPHAKELIVQCKNYINNPEAFRGRWSEYFGNDHEIRLEVGAGKGKFIVESAADNPNINYIAVEKCATIALKFLRSVPETLVNLVVVGMDAEKLDEFLAESEISRLYLNFSDPWPKKRHEKRRLTNGRFIEIYQRILKDGSLLEFKTDNRPFFDYSLEQFRDSAFILEGVTYDLYNSEFLEGNKPTEYELRFHNMGVPINKLVARLDKSRIRK